MARAQLGALAVFTFVLLGAALALENHARETYGEAGGEFGIEGEAFRRTLEVRLPAGAKVGVASFGVPSGRRVALELAGARSRGLALTARIVTEGVGEERREHRLDLAPAQALRAFADAGTTVTLVVERTDGAGGAEVSVTLHGTALEVP
jgi:hypothetical protein